MSDCMTRNGEFGSLGSGHSDPGGNDSICTPMIRSISSTSFCLIRLVTLTSFFPCIDARMPRALAVLPLDDSMIYSCSRTHSMSPRAVRSLIDQNGFIYSSFANISTHMSPCIVSGIRRRCVLPISSVIVFIIICVISEFLLFQIVS